MAEDLNCPSDASPGNAPLGEDHNGPADLFKEDAAALQRQEGRDVYAPTQK